MWPAQRKVLAKEHLSLEEAAVLLKRTRLSAAKGTPAFSAQGLGEPDAKKAKPAAANTSETGGFAVSRRWENFVEF